mmetsp:Transcript_7462/g.14589  ORF Transcript_7462/g.14589 Transcript_7462/m.14589 type:complete len:450 (-) Transcript_7462:110-1459(-)|eukprot:CAMPEP_0170171926 /NCGR_PEP_ID=MMETSP0040_2-20121228/5137_1 /TAXON_ID=641309 /ORGANISM="Lotharella oceanica, Strain CCMP622" /LENGTH=449 /DNA_ID=CAMNT_0010412287 /DNA_START=36 /DNA_END=1385 /DNA_ORIENTATION=+
MTDNKKSELLDYYVGKTLGKGLTSTVKIGIHKKTGEKVALKILKLEKLNGNLKYKQAMEADIVALKKVKHPNVLNLLAADLDAKMGENNAPVMVLELATNGELMDYLMYTGSFSEDVARTYFHQLIDAMKTCHDAGIRHRDLKPDNLLLDANFQLKIADFGFSSDQDIMYTYTGTKSYMAPEIAAIREGKANGYTKACDIWSSGVILFIMSAGFPPYQEPSKHDWWFTRLKSKNFKMFWKAHETHHPQFTADFKELIEMILQVDPTKRASIEDILKSKWMKGTVLSKEDLLKELKRKKPAVDEEKHRQCLESKSDSSSNMTTRFGAPAGGAGVATQGAERIKIEDYLDVKSLPEPVKYEEPTVASYTTVQCKLKAQKALERVVRIVAVAGPGTKFSRSGYELEAEMQSVRIAIEIFAEDDASRIVFRRLAGSWSQFRKIYGYFISKLSS